MEKHGLVPDIVDTVPPQVLQIKYGSEVVIAGKELTPTQVKEMPTVEWNAESGSYYTLIFMDPDAPSREDPSIGAVKHWLVVNIPGNNIEEGETLAEFMGSAPHEGSGLHRYTYFVFKQPGEINVEDEPRASASSLSGRLHFNLRDFAAKYNLGEPIGCNFYLAQYDDYCKIFHAMIAAELERFSITY